MSGRRNQKQKRKEAETSMKAEWDAWLKANAGAVKNTIGMGKTKRISASGVEDAKNGIMLSSYVEAESLEAAAETIQDPSSSQAPRSNDRSNADQPAQRNVILVRTLGTFGIVSVMKGLSSGTVHKLPQDLRRALIATPAARAVWGRSYAAGAQ
jgi:hypothetical protein